MKNISVVCKKTTLVCKTPISNVFVVIFLAKYTSTQTILRMTMDTQHKYLKLEWWDALTDMGHA